MDLNFNDIPDASNKKETLSFDDIPAVSFDDIPETDSFVEGLGKAVENTPDRFKVMAGGLTRAAADDHIPGEGAVSQMARDSARGEEPGFFDTLKAGADIVQGMPRYLLDKMTPTDSPLGKLKKSASAAGQKMSDEAQKDLAENQPHVQGAIQQFGIDAARGIIDMVPSIAAGVATKSAATGLAVMGAQVGGQAYNDYLNKGMSPGEAMLATRFTVLAEIIPETIPMGAILKRGTPLAKRLFDSTIGQGAQEMITSVLEQAYDKRHLENMSLKDAMAGIDWGQVVYDGAVGVAVGGALAAGAHPFTGGEEAPQQTTSSGEPINTEGLTEGLSGPEALPPAATSPDAFVVDPAGNARPELQSETVDRARGEAEAEKPYHVDFTSPAAAGLTKKGPLTAAVEAYGPQANGLTVAPVEDVQSYENGVDFGGIPYVERAKKKEVPALDATVETDREADRRVAQDTRLEELKQQTKDIVTPEGLDDPRIARVPVREELQAKVAVPVRPRTDKVDPEVDDLMTAVTKLGGISKEEAKAQGIDPEHFTDKVGKANPFRTNGESFDGMAEKLSQYGYLPAEGYSANDLLDKMGESLSGHPVISNQYNPDFEAGAGLAREGLSPEQVQAAVRKSLDGQRLGVREARVVRSLLDEVSGDRAARVDDLKPAHDMLRRALRGFAPVEDYQADSERYGDRMNEEFHTPEASAEARAIRELADEADKYDESLTEYILERPISDIEVARLLYEVIHDGRQAEKSGQTTERARVRPDDAQEGSGVGSETDVQAEKPTEEEITAALEQFNANHKASEAKNKARYEDMIAGLRAEGWTEQGPPSVSQKAKSETQKADANNETEIAAAKKDHEEAYKQRDLEAMSAATDKASKAFIQEIKDRIDAGNLPVIKHGSIYSVVHPSTRKPGSYQITNYNDAGALSDTTVDSIDKIRGELSAINSEFVPVDEAGPLMDKLGAAEAKYQEGKTGKPAKKYPKQEALKKKAKPKFPKQEALKKKAKGQTDMFGQDETKQAIHDKKEARKAKERNAPPMHEGAGDLFSDKSKQTDIEDVTKGPKQGKVGEKMASGEVVLTSTGRETTPFPKFDLKTSRKSINSVKRIDQWLMQNAIDEARSRGDDFNLAQFEANKDKPSQADKDSAEYYLFDPDFVQPVPKQITKPLVAEKPEDRAAKPEQKQYVPPKVAKKKNSATKKADVPVAAKKEGVEKQEEKPETTAKDVSEKKKTLWGSHESIVNSMRNGSLTLERYRNGFKELAANREAVLAELAKETKATLLGRMDAMTAHRYKGEKKDSVVASLYTDMLRDYAWPSVDGSGMMSYSPKVGGDHIQNMIDAMREKVESVTEEKLRAYADRIAESEKSRKEERAQRERGLEDPKTIDDYRGLINAKAKELGDGATFRDAFMMLKPEQRVAYDALVAEQNRSARKESKTAQRTEVRVAAETTGAKIIEGMHTKFQTPLWIVQPDERVDSDSYKTLLSAAKRMGGNYVNTMQARRWKTDWGYQFPDMEKAEAFMKLMAGDKGDAQEVVKARRNEYEDDRSQSAVERLTEMADKLEAKADELANRDRKTNTSRRAGMAARAEAQAESQRAIAVTMRNIAQKIEAGETKYLDQVRTKAQVEMITGFLNTAQYDQLKERYPNYRDYEKHKGEPIDTETADYAQFPNYTAYRSDLARLGRQALEVDGMKKIGQRIMKVADDVSKAYLKFAKEHLNEVNSFRKKDGEIAAFKTKAQAEKAIAVSGFRGEAIVLPFKRGENLIILSPAEAQKRGVWDGDNDKRITLSPDLIDSLIGKARRTHKLDVPWQFESAHEKRTRLSSMGIETPSEFRAMLREFVGLREVPKEADKIKQMERAMIGRKKDGLDFFPTAEPVADEAIDIADIKEGMDVLEPSAGMGHIADRIRETGVEPDVIELSGERRELLEAKGYNVVGSDFMEYDDKKYDRIIMNPPFSDRRDAKHLLHAYDLLKPDGRLVAIVGEGVFFGNDKKAKAFRNWLDDVGGSEEKLPEGSFQDPNLPVNTSVNARMVVIDKSEVGTDKAKKVLFSADHTPPDNNTFTQNDNPAAGGFSVSEVRKAIATQVLKLSTAYQKRVNVVQKVSDLPDDIRSAAEEVGNVAGAYYAQNDAVYLVAENIKSAAHARRILAHEVTGHMGMEDMLGAEFDGILKSVQFLKDAGDKAVNDAASIINERRGKLDANEEASEIIAVIAEQGIRTPLMKRVIAAVRKFLRKLGFSLSFSTSELEALIAKSGRYVQTAKESQVRARKNQSPRFSTDRDNEQVDPWTENAPDTEAKTRPTRPVKQKKSAKKAQQHQHEFGNLNAEQEQALRNVGGIVDKKTMREHIAAIRENFTMKMVQGVVDQFAPIKALDEHAYILDRLSKGSEGALEALMTFGNLRLIDGVTDSDAHGTGVIETLQKLQGEQHRFMWWLAANRAEQLSADNRENLFGDTDIKVLKGLSDGKMPDGQNRGTVYATALKEYNAASKQVLDLAEQSGIIDGESRATWEKEFYVPFYRALEDGYSGPNIGKGGGLVRQYAFKQLKGGKEKLHQDLLANVLMNWSHLITASAKNRGAEASLKAAERAGVATRLEADQKNAVWYLGEYNQMIPEGQKYIEDGVEKVSDGTAEVRMHGKIFYSVEDPLVLSAITALEFSGFGGRAMKMMGAFKRALTIGVTANPAFKIRNLIRDTLTAVGQTEISYNPLKNVADGAKIMRNKKGQLYASLLASGGLIRFGTMLDGNRSSHIDKLINAGVDVNTIVDTPEKIKDMMQKTLDWYNNLGDISEGVNRAALYDQLLQQEGHAKAAYAARDMMDFSMGGTFGAVRFLVQTVPFMNARAQGIYKLGRSAKENPKRMGAVVGATALASIALMLAYQDDDDWKAREDWDRDNYWWFKINGVAYRIPKPFEIGAVATLAERGAEVFASDEMTAKRFYDRLQFAVSQTFAMNPIPQAIKPWIDVYANQDSFTGRPIESMGMERLMKPDRFTPRTSEAAKLLGQAGDLTGLSPVQIDFLVRSYFGWLGMAAVTAADEITKPMLDRAPRASRKLKDTFLVGNFAETLPARNTRYLTRFYEQSREIEEAYASYRNKLKNGDKVGAKQLMAAHPGLRREHKRAGFIKRRLSRINAKIRQIENSRLMNPDAKRRKLDVLTEKKNALAERVMDIH